MGCESFQQVEVWRKAHAWVLGVYRLTDSFPKHELYGLTSQLRRAAVSVPTNFAEGFKRRGQADKARFINIAQGSLEECRYLLILAGDLQYGETRDSLVQLDEVARMLSSYYSRVVEVRPVSRLP